MAKLKDLIARYCLHRIADHHDPAGSAISSADKQTLADVIQLALDRGEQIKLLKETDRKRAAIHRKLKKRLRKYKRLANAQHKTIQKLLWRTRILRDGTKSRQTQIRYQEQLLAEKSFLPNLAPPRRPSMSVPHFVERYIWRYWMRLGVLFQYAPEPLRKERFPVKNLADDRQPKISIVTPSFMQGHFLEATIESILSQDYPNLEYIIMDGGSTDGSKGIIENNAAHIAHWESKPDQGQAAAIKRGFEHSSGEIMAWLNSDDLYLPGLLRFVGEYFTQNPGVDIIYGNRIIIDDHGDEVGRWILPGHDKEMLLWNDYIPQETLFWRRGIYEKVGGIDDSFQFALDWDLLLRFYRGGANIVHLPYFMGRFRAHQNQKSVAWINSVGKEEIAKIRKRELGNRFTERALQHRVNRFQIKAVLRTKLQGLGIRL